MMNGKWIRIALIIFLALLVLVAIRLHGAAAHILL